MVRSHCGSHAGVVALLVLQGAWVGSPAAQTSGEAPAWLVADAVQSGAEELPYRVLATRRASTMERELNEMAEAGFRFHSANGSTSSPRLPFDRSELMVVVERDGRPGRFSYRVAGSGGDLQAFLNEASEDGFRVRSSARWRVILERDADVDAVPVEYRVVTTTRVSTLEREIAAAADDGFTPVRLLAPAAVEGLVVILSRPTSHFVSPTVP